MGVYGIRNSLELSALFDGNRLSQVTRLVDFSAPLFGDIVGKKLGCDREGDTGEFIADRGNIEDVGGYRGDFRGTFKSNRKNRASPRFHFG